MKTVTTCHRMFIRKEGESKRICLRVSDYVQIGFRMLTCEKSIMRNNNNINPWALCLVEPWWCFPTHIFFVPSIFTPPTARPTPSYRHYLQTWDLKTFLLFRQRVRGRKKLSPYMRVRKQKQNRPYAIKNIIQ